MARVLIVDDSGIVRLQVSRALRQAGFEVLEASDGVEALEKMEASAAINLLICDINMPRMNGLELLETLKARGVVLPILMLTTEGQPALVQRAKDAGAKAWIIKPFKSDVIIAAANKLAA